jgi:hypothetical protein
MGNSAQILTLQQSFFPKDLMGNGTLRYAILVSQETISKICLYLKAEGLYATKHQQVTTFRQEEPHMILRLTLPRCIKGARQDAVVIKGGCVGSSKYATAPLLFDGCFLANRAILKKPFRAYTRALKRSHMQ